MLVKSLSEAKRIVSNNPLLEWDGWTIVEWKRNRAGWMMKNGAYRDGRWYATRRFEVDRDGWSLPDRYGGRHR